MLAALAYTLLMASGLGFGEHGVAVDHDMALGVDHDVNAGAANYLHTGNDGGHSGSLARLLGLFGVGKVPPSSSFSYRLFSLGGPSAWR